jgi:hypothetical protein
MKRPIRAQRFADGGGSKWSAQYAFWSRIESDSALTALELRKFLIVRSRLEIASRMTSVWPGVICGLATVIRDPWPAICKRGEGRAHHRVMAALSAVGNDAMSRAVSYFSFHPKLTRRRCGESCSSGQTWDGNSTEPVSTGRQRFGTCTFPRGGIAQLSVCQRASGSAALFLRN